MEQVMTTEIVYRIRLGTEGRLSGSAALDLEGAKDLLRFFGDRPGDKIVKITTIEEEINL